MQVCTSLQTDNYDSTPQLSFFTGRMPFLPPNQQRQSTEGKNNTSWYKNAEVSHFNRKHILITLYQAVWSTLNRRHAEAVKLTLYDNNNNHLTAVCPGQPG